MDIYRVLKVNDNEWVVVTSYNSIAGYSKTEKGAVELALHYSREALKKLEAHIQGLLKRMDDLMCAS